MRAAPSLRPPLRQNATAQACEPAQLPPLLDGDIAALVYGQPQLLLELAARHGSPLNIVWPHCLERNVAAMRAVLDEQRLPYAIFYGAKVNKSRSLVRAAVDSGVGVDVSSLYELRDALRAGADGARICATGPAKTAAFHRELLACGALISVDSPEELNDIAAAAASPAVAAGANANAAARPARPARLLLRYRPESARGSRFGMDAAQLEQCLHLLARERERLFFEGFHFHLGGYGHESRAQALRELLPLVDAARGLGLHPRMIDIGGGLPIRYVENARYAAFLQAQQAGDYRNGRLPSDFYPYGGKVDAPSWLRQLLAAPAADSVGGATLADTLRALDVTLALEPGRSLADQAGITVFRITRVKALADGRTVLFAEGSSFSACETWFASEYLVDPVLVRRDPAAAAQPCRAYIAGHSCLDDDVISNRFIDFSAVPVAGDLLVYANTAGYQMDLLENEFHRHPMPRRLRARLTQAAILDVSPDDFREQDDDDSEQSERVNRQYADPRDFPPRPEFPAAAED